LENATSNGERVMGSLLEAAHRLAPDAVTSTVASHLEMLGMTGVVICLVDLDQRLLVPLGIDDAPPAEPLDIDGTLPGKAFRAQQVMVERLPDGGGCRVWTPLIDGADRLGVLGVIVADADEVTVNRARHMASITSSLVVSKSEYGDNLVRARRRRDIDLAAELRWAMLPPLTFVNDRVAVAGMLEPAYEIAGDAFDYAVNGDVAHVAIIDAMGHGLEASRMANLAVGSYRHSRRRGDGLIETFAAMDETIADQFGPGKFVTGQMASLDLTSGELSWVNAGHPRPLVRRDGRPSDDLVCETALPLGLGSVPAEVAQLTLGRGDSVLFMTDGVIEARSPAGEQAAGPALGRSSVDG
jgi:sigma-B regulation protein RsbU (phosphoserine phosphatase)